VQFLVNIICADTSSFLTCPTRWIATKAVHVQHVSSASAPTTHRAAPGYSRESARIVEMKGQLSTQVTQSAHPPCQLPFRRNRRHQVLCDRCLVTL
jgi:hypothetical protein